MPRNEIVSAESAAARLVDEKTTEIRFLKNDNQTLRVMLPPTALYALAQRMSALRNPQEDQLQSPIPAPKVAAGAGSSEPLYPPKKEKRLLFASFRLS